VPSNPLRLGIYRILETAIRTALHASTVCFQLLNANISLIAQSTTVNASARQDLEETNANNLCAVLYPMAENVTLDKATTANALRDGKGLTAMCVPLTRCATRWCPPAVMELAIEAV